MRGLEEDDKTPVKSGYFGFFLGARPCASCVEGCPGPRGPGEMYVFADTQRSCT